jgi:hypothetical protein
LKLTTNKEIPMMIYDWSPARNADQHLTEFSRGAARWEGGDLDDVQFLIFGKLEGSETDYEFRREVRLVRKGLEALGFEVCDFNTYYNAAPTTSWAFVVRPKVRPRHELEEQTLEMRLVHLAWKVWRVYWGIRKGAAPQQPLPKELVRHDAEGRADALPLPDQDTDHQR